MANKFEIPEEVEQALRDRHKKCAYCRIAMKEYPGRIGTPGDKATIEHLNRRGPFYWSDKLKAEDLVICCGRCNSSRGTKRLRDWFKTAYRTEQGISEGSVATEVRRYLMSARSRL